MFKVVEIKTSTRKPQISLVPAKWVEGDTVFWPKTNASILLKDPKSEPLPSWDQHKCVVKKSCIESYDAARRWEKVFLNSFVDTESELE